MAKGLITYNSCNPKGLEEEKMPKSRMLALSAVSCFCSKGATAQRDHLVATGGTGSPLWKAGIKATVESTVSYQAGL